MRVARIVLRRLLLAGALFVPASSRAQIPVPTQPPTPTPLPVLPAVVLPESLAAFERPNGALLRPGTLRYQLSLRKADGQSVPLGARTVVVTDSALGGTPGWLIAESRTGTVVETTDSVFVARGDLTPVRWIATIGRAQFGASFTRDSMYGAVQSYQGRFSFAVAVPAGTLLSAGMVERVAELLPLRIGYHAGATLLVVDGVAPHALLAELRVDRDERIDVGGRTADCWVLAIDTGALELRLWIDKQGSRVVRTEQATAEGLLVATLLG